jgi:hypothetical protein
MSQNHGLKLFGILICVFAATFAAYLVGDAIRLVRMILDWAPGNYLTDAMHTCQLIGWFVLSWWAFRTAESGYAIFRDQRRPSIPYKVVDGQQPKQPQQQNGQHQQHQQNQPRNQQQQGQGQPVKN